MDTFDSVVSQIDILFFFFFLSFSRSVLAGTSLFVAGGVELGIRDPISFECVRNGIRVAVENLSLDFQFCLQL